jgi:hypothetical protein
LCNPSAPRHTRPKLRATSSVSKTFALDIAHTFLADNRRFRAFTYALAPATIISVATATPSIGYALALYPYQDLSNDINPLGNAKSCFQMNNSE